VDVERVTGIEPA